MMSTSSINSRMDTAYLKQTVGPAISEALSELILHGHAQTHPKLSTNLEFNSYSTSEDPITFVARYLLNYSETLEKCKRDDQERDKITAMIEKIRKRKKDEETAQRKIDEEKKAQELLIAQMEQDKVNVPINEAKEVVPEAQTVAPEAEQIQSTEIKAPEQNSPAPEVTEGQ